MPSFPAHWFYGWAVVGASFFAQLIVVGIALYAPPVFLLPLESHFGWSRAAIAAGPGLAALICGLVSPLIGTLTDRYGPRLVMLWGVVILGTSEVLLSQITTVAQYYLICSILPVGLAAAAWVPNQTLVANWFVRKRGAAMGVALTGIGIGGLVMASLAGLLIECVGWRAAYAILGGSVLGLVTPVVWWVVRDKPSEMGLPPDGEGNPTPARPGPSQGGPASFTFEEVVRSPGFWMLALVEFCAVLGSLAIIGHLPAFLADHGASRTIAANVLAITIGLSVAGRLLYGYLGDRLRKKPAMISTLVIFAAADLVLLLVPRPGALPGFVVLFGLGLGGSAVLVPLLVGDYFGLAAFARTVGSLMVAATVAAAIGPVALGVIYDRSGSYALGFALLAVVFALGAVAMALANPPRQAVK